MADAPLPSYAVRTTQRPKLSEEVKRAIEDEVGRGKFGSS